MSEPIDIKALDEYLKGNSDISQRYREIGRADGPSPELDRRVLDEARAAVAGGSGNRSRSWLRWGAPLALAASVVLAVTVVIESGVQDDASFANKPVAADKATVEPQRQLEEYKLQEQTVAQPSQEPHESQFAAEPPVAVAPQAAPAPIPASPPPAALAKSEAERSENVTQETTVDAKVLRDQSLATSPVEVAAEAAPVDSPSVRQDAGQAQPEADSSDDELTSASGGNFRARRAGRTAGPRSTVSGSALSSERRPVADDDMQRSDPQKWLEAIRELRRTGKAEEADRAWLQFREAYPKFPVADDDLARRK